MLRALWDLLAGTQLLHESAVQEDPDALGYFLGDPANMVAETPISVPDTFPADWVAAFKENGR